MKRKIFAALVMGAAVMIVGCASSGNKITRNLLITSEPQGAVVYMDGDMIGETPLKIQTFFTWNKSEPYDSLLRRVIQVKKAGYVPQSRELLPIDMPNITFFLVNDGGQESGKGGAK